MARYRKALQQKNALLRAAPPLDEELLGVYDRTLIEAGAQIMLARHHFVAELAEVATRAHARFAAGERLAVRYEPNVAIDTPLEDAIVAAFEAARADGQGRVELDGALVEWPAYSTAKRLLARHEAMREFEADGST